MVYNPDPNPTLPGRGRERHGKMESGGMAALGWKGLSLCTNLCTIDSSCEREGYDDFSPLAHVEHSSTSMQHAASISGRVKGTNYV